MKNTTRVFRKTVRKGKPMHHPLLSLDIENDPVTGKFINAAVYGEKNVRSHGKAKAIHIEDFFTSQKKFLKFLEDLRPPGMKEIPTKIILFNASYDYWFLMKITKDGDLLTNGSNIITGRLRNGIQIIDLTNLTRKGSLEDWIGYLKMKDPFTGEPIVKDKLRDADLEDSEDLFNPTNPNYLRAMKTLEARVKSDAKATWILGNYLENFFVNEIGIPLKLTIASAARYLFSLRFFTDYWYRDEKHLWLSEYERKAYRGGRVEAFKSGVERIFVGYDVNSMYLSIMRDEVFPDPNSAKYIREPKVLPGWKLDADSKDSKDYIPLILESASEALYIADVTVIVPEQYIGSLPTLSPNTGKLIFPTGTFRGHFASPELNYAIKECGVKVLEIHSLIKYKAKPYFKEYAEFVWKKRKEYKDKGIKGMDILIKYLGNTLYGGFGQRNKDSFFGKLEDLTLEFIADTKAKPSITEIDDVKYVTVTTTRGEDSEHTFPCEPVFITSFSRVLLLKALRANADNLIYTDTDSMKLRNVAKETVIGDGLGEWGYEGVEINVSVYKSKMYGCKCKGVPKRAQLEWEDEVRKIYSYEKPNKMKESFRRGLTPAKWNKKIKEVSKIDDKRQWISEKVSLPPVIDITVPQHHVFKEVSDSTRQRAFSANNTHVHWLYKEGKRTDLTDEDSTLRRTEKEEDMVNEMKRYCTLI